MIRPLSILATPRLLLVSALLLSPLAWSEAEAASEALEPEVAETPAVPETEAEAALAAALTEAERTDRLVFVHSGAPW
jgi:hypothetical protein